MWSVLISSPPFTMGLYKNRKGVVHALKDDSPQVKKWLKDEQITKLNKAEREAYAIKIGRGKKAKAAPVAKPVATAPATTPDVDPIDPDATQDTTQDDPAETPEPIELDLAREEYTKLYAEQPNSRWNLATLKKKIAEVAPKK